MLSERAGFLSRDDQQAKPEKLVKTYIDKSGKKRCVGVKKKLKESQKLG